MSTSYSSDRPIQSKKNDLLGRAKFAEHLADDIHSWGGDDSLVIALYGAWGSGKTSVKNMLLEANQKKGRTPLSVIDFNPWQLTGTGGIRSSFFRELGLALKKAGPVDDVEKREQKLNAYAATLQIAGTATELLGKALPFSGVPGGPLVESFGQGLKSAGVSAKEGSEALKASNESAAKSLEEQKRDLSVFLARLPQPLLVVIDDIDRLTTEEILQVVQLVKANADFPRIIYLLLFEREIVAKALNQVSCDKGMEFLEKIIQVGYHIPHASRAAVEKALFAGLARHLDNLPVSKYWDKHRWRDIYSGGMNCYFRNLRHVYRFLASFEFHVRHHRSKKSFEVNPVDLFGLECLRIFEPGVYERLPDAKSILTRDELSILSDDIEQEDVDQALEQIVSAGVPTSQSVVRGLLSVLFPPISSSYGVNSDVSRHHKDWLRQLRVCHPDLFDRYFTLTIADNDLSQSELDRFIALAADAQKFQSACRAFKKRGLLNLAFDRLDVYAEQIPLKAVPSLILALCDMGDAFPEERPRPFAQFLDSLNSCAWRLCYSGLGKEPNTKKRFQILNDAITRSSGLVVPFELVSLFDRETDAEARGRAFLLDQSDVEILKRLCVEKFRSAIDNPSLRRSPRFHVVLLRWSYWEAQDEVKSVMKTLLCTPADALWLMTVLLGESHSLGQDIRVRYSMALEMLERFTDIAHLAELVSKMESDKLSKREKIALREFNKARKRRSDGQSDHVGHVWDDPDEEVVE